MRIFSSALHPGQYSPLTLAYLGDAVYEVYIREFLVKKGNISAHKLHDLSKKYVCATGQSIAMGRLENILSEEEKQIYRRGRNAKAYTAPKNAGITEYRRATGLEALIGYLHLMGRDARIETIMETIVSE